MKKYLYNPPRIVKNIFSDFIWETKNNKILLTFDDGPFPETTEVILKYLNEQKIKAALFCVGENCQKYPELISSLINDNHLIANHTFHHKKINKLNKIERDSEIDSFNKLMSEKYNYEVKYFRPPHGRFNFSTSKFLREKKLKNVMWSLLTYDYKNDIKLVKFAVQNFLKQNSIIVLHDSVKSKNIIIDSIKIILDEAAKNGFEIGEPAECLK